MHKFQIHYHPWAIIGFGTISWYNIFFLIINLITIYDSFGNFFIIYVWHTNWFSCCRIIYAKNYFFFSSNLFSSKTWNSEESSFWIQDFVYSIYSKYGRIKSYLIIRKLLYQRSNLYIVQWLKCSVFTISKHKEKVVQTVDMKFKVFYENRLDDINEWTIFFLFLHQRCKFVLWFTHHT